MDEYIDTEVRLAQDNYMLYLFSMSTLTKNAQNKIRLWEDEYKIGPNNTPCGACLVKVVAMTAHISNAQAQFIWHQLTWTLKSSINMWMSRLVLYNTGKWAWLKEQPKPGDPVKKTKDGKVWYWCCHHAAWGYQPQREKMLTQSETSKRLKSNNLHPVCKVQRRWSCWTNQILLNKSNRPTMEESCAELTHLFRFIYRFTWIRADAVGILCRCVSSFYVQVHLLTCGCCLHCFLCTFTLDLRGMQIYWRHYYIDRWFTRL